MDAQEDISEFVEKITALLSDVKDMEFDEQEYCIELLQELKRTCEMWLEEEATYEKKYIGI